MPQFHFHVTLRGDLFEDRDGCNYFDIESAMIYGRRLAINLGSISNFTGATVLLVDVLGHEVARFPVTNVVALARARYATDPSCDTRKADPDPLRADIPPGGR